MDDKQLRSDLIKKRDDIVAQIAAMNVDLVSFSVDANIINRLGKELIGRAETGVSELIKNAYDADATLVKVDFINSNVTGGSLVIKDDGIGMTRDGMIGGFMTLSTATKVHEPISPKFKRQRAGRKGIGRFATQFLGEKLTITSQVEEEQFATRITINWNSYSMDKDISAIENRIETITKEIPHGTTLCIEKLRHSWSTAQINRVFRYVSDLLQPTFLSETSSELKLAQQGDKSFLVECYRTENGLTTTIADIQKVLFEKALAVFEGHVDDNGGGFVRIKSSGFRINDSDLAISAKKQGGDVIERYKVLRNVHFRVYYFIYGRQEYYNNGITKLELNNIEDIAEQQSGVRVYRNGFRVLPYGEIGDDWLGLDRRTTRIQFELEEQNVNFNIPYTNKNLFGFVELIDKQGELFEETASREGLIENDALRELKDFVRKAIIVCVTRISPFVYSQKKQRDKNISNERSIREKVAGIQSKIDEFTKQVEHENKISSGKSDKKQQGKEIKGLLSDLHTDLKGILDELAMLRILAALGITIGEFTHEIIQFPIFFNSKLSSLLIDEPDAEKRESIEQVLEKINHLDTYTSYFNDAVSRNAKRDLEIIELRRVIRPFIASNKWDFEYEKISVSEAIEGYDIYTVPMHPSEWHSIILNLYTNSKKALRRASPSEKKILISAGKDDKNVYLEFSDNGDGINEENKNLVFDAFFTTSTPASLGARQSENIVGSGLGLKILKDIITEYRGDIFVTAPPNGYSTCIRIEIPKASDEEIENFEK